MIARSLLYLATLKLSILIFVLLSVITLRPSPAWPETVISSPPSEDLKIKRHTLPNSLKVFHVERHDLPIVVINLLIKAGSKEEPPEKAGLASLVAEMLPEGTETMKADEISEALEFVGASFSVETDYDYTLISLSFLKKDLRRVFKVFKEIIGNPIFPEEELQKKKSILITSLQKKREEPSYVAMKLLRERLFKDHPYGRPVEGTPETVKTITRDDLIDFYRRFYRPERSIMVIAGDITSEEIKEITEELKSWNCHFTTKAVKGGAQISEKRNKEGTTFHPETIIINRDLTQANILYGLPGIKRRDPEYYPASVMNYILGGGGFGSRLMQRIRDEMGLAYDVSSYFTINEEPGLFVISLQTKNDQAIKAIEIIKEEIKRILTEPVKDEEIEEAKAYLTGSLIRRLDTTKKIADFLSFAEFYGLGDDYIKRYPEYIRSVTKEDIIKTAKRLLSTDGVIVIVGREKEIRKN